MEILTEVLNRDPDFVVVHHGEYGVVGDAAERGQRTGLPQVEV